ncbi:MAG: ABC transporter permease [Chitinophagaceae bacterium]|nr:ABC transporter permease [Chitinophagaceae bacterium]MBL0305956.1 ABC transporter permease [Chitinophagaceae bacterium]HQV61767.1 permease-like cell division protein FtsX [Chitinophagaceae bacterium]HQV87324.1 permease-like cell division protein FtsX [Chitinophagaceae bacterium]HQX74455.1 permease-like cell division protein FtsX [Chitinophagaceae bacterium]
MSQSGKASIKRGKPSYFMSILGVTLVLFLLGIIGWLVINANKLGDYFKENVEVRAYLRGDLNPKDSVALMNYISAKPYVKSIQYVSKEEGKKIYMQEESEDWSKVLDENPLPNAIYFRIKNQYVNLDTLTSIKADLEAQTYVSDVKYPEALVGKLNKNIRVVSIWLLVLVVIISIVVIFLIDNTIRLAMFSNRFLIKTMQMVGATRWFIAKPLNVRAIINGAISGLIASALLYLVILIAEGSVDWLKTIHDSGLLLLLFFILIVLGIVITLFSTHRSVVKYLKMRLDDLY